MSQGIDSLCLGFNGAADFYAVVALNHIDARGSHRFPFPITLRANRRKALGPRLVLLLQTPLSAPALRGAALPPIRHTAERPGEQGSHVEPSGARRAPIGPGESRKAEPARTAPSHQRTASRVAAGRRLMEGARRCARGRALGGALRDCGDQLRMTAADKVIVRRRCYSFARYSAALSRNRFVISPAMDSNVLY
jgi:hypothetical protein